MLRLRSIAILLVAYQVASVTALDSLVLCLGTDGHIALEALVDEGSCESVSPGTAVHLRGPASAMSDNGDGSHCGPCRDVDFRLGTAEQTPSRDRMLELSALFAGASPDSLPSPKRLQVCGMASDRLRLPDLTGSTPNLLRSTILLI